MLQLSRALSLTFAILTAVQATSDSAKELQAWQGEWEVVSMLHAGKEVPGLKDKKMVFTFQGDKVIVKIADKIVNEGTCILDPAKTPRTIDIKDSRNTIIGIYELKGNNAKMCMGARGSSVRPKEFTANPGTDQSLVTLKRLKK